MHNSYVLLLGAFIESVGGDSRNVDKLKRREVKAGLLSTQRNDSGVFGGLKQDETTWEKSRQCRVRGFLSLQGFAIAKGFLKPTTSTGGH